jgi:hypothetical protein
MGESRYVLQEAEMADSVIETKGGPLTVDDFESEAPSPGTSDPRYSGEGKKRLETLADKVAAMAKKNAEA